MANIIDYLEWRGDIPMSVSPFNIVDSLILSTYAYLDLEGIANGDGDPKWRPTLLALSEVANKYRELERLQDDLFDNPDQIMDAVNGTVRFGSIKVGHFKKMFDAKNALQFSAMTFFLSDGSIYIGYCGTDNSVTGWREDFNMSYLEETKGQREALNYLEIIAGKYRRAIRIGGHSKGGNLALFAGTYCSPKIKKRIESIDSFDGPGLSDEAIQKKEYIEIVNKTKLIIPEESLIGILMSNKAQRQIVKSDAKGIFQHSAYSWQVKKDSFELADKQSGTSNVAEETIKKWLDELSFDQKKMVVTALFDAIESSGIDNFAELKNNKLINYNAILRELFAKDDETKKAIVESIQKLAGKGNEIIVREAQEKLKAISDAALVRIKETSMPNLNFKLRDRNSGK